MCCALVVSAIVQETDEIKSYELVDAQGTDLPIFDAGAHIELILPKAGIRQYSLCNDPIERHRYRIAVKRDENGRGGSRFMHDRVEVGTIFPHWTLRNTFGLDDAADRYVLVAGGIGITPILSMMARIKRAGRPFELHYCAKSEARAAFLDVLKEEGNVSFHYSRAGSERWPVADELSAVRPGTQVYCCGPASLIAAVRDATCAWPPGAVHWEFFSAEASLNPRVDQAFSITLASTGDVYTVPSDRTILGVLREQGVHVDSSCEAGACGTCQVRYLEGEPDHRDLYLEDSERGEFVMVCVSRSKSPNLKLDL